MYRLEMKHIFKSFGGVKALSDVSFQAKPGEVHALIGENGAGKSTLMKVLAGAITKDSGDILIEGREVNLNSPKSALESGISVIYQELNMVSDLSVAENIFLDDFLRKGCFVQWKEMYEQSEHYLAQLGVQISPKKTVGEMTVARQQMVEIAKAIKNKSKIVVFDEPSAVLGKQDSELLFKQIEKLKSQGVSVIYISHRLDEILRITDRVTVLRDGTYIATKETKDLKMEDLVSYMTGKSYGDMWTRKEYTPNENEIVLEVKNLSRKNVVNDVSFHVRKGEILGLAGLVGSGRSEIARVLFGADPKSGGEIYLHGEKITIKNPQDARRCGIGFVLEDRKTEGLLIDRSIMENITITDLKRYKKGLLLDNKKEKRAAKEFKGKLLIKTNDLDNPVMSLSGGNQQKVSIAKWMHIEPEVLILDEPTRGVDVGAKSEIYKLIEQLKEQGKAVIVISSEFSEILGLSDRIIVIRRGSVVGEFTQKEIQNDSSILETFSDGEDAI